jgi:hemerythrin-like metal-binding protein
MKKLEWSGYFATGHGQTDERHKEILETCNNMVDHWQAGDTERCAQDFVQCGRLCERHFNEENDLLDQLIDFNVAKHVTDHQTVLEKLSGMQHDCQTTCRGEACLSEVMHVIMGHILKFDLDLQRKFGRPD